MRLSRRALRSCAARVAPVLGAALLWFATVPPAAAAAALQELPLQWRQAPAISLWPVMPPGWPAGFLRNVDTPQLKVFLPAQPNGHAVLVIPGGAYQFVSVINEGVELAPRLTGQGFTVFVLVYRLPGEGWPDRSRVALQDAQRAMRVIRSQAQEYGVVPDRVSVIGFSAGGHLAAMLATRHAEQTYARVDANDGLDPRPLGVALVYPVATMQSPWTHELSRNLLLGEQATPMEIDRNSAELRVTGSTPPLFVVHALDDEAVPAENSMRLIEATRAAKRPYELHLLQEGGHAFGIGRPGTPSAYWVDQFGAWVGRLAP